MVFSEFQIFELSAFFQNRHFFLNLSKKVHPPYILKLKKNRKESRMKVNQLRLIGYTKHCLFLSLTKSAVSVKKGKGCFSFVYHCPKTSPSVPSVLAFEYPTDDSKIFFKATIFTQIN